jgi:hypothetical protein
MEGHRITASDRDAGAGNIFVAKINLSRFLLPKAVRKKVDDRINEEGGKKGGREENFDLVDYRDIITANWTLFEATLGRGNGSKDVRTKWIVEVNDLRKPVMHASKGVSLPTH